MPSTTSRLLMLLSLLQARREWPGEVLAERLDISHRTVRRDVDRLRELGYAIRAVKGPHGGYRLDAGAELPPLLFDDDQVIALAVALRSATSTGAGIEEAAGRALATISQVMPSRLRRRLDSLRFTTLPAVGREPRRQRRGSCWPCPLPSVHARCCGSTMRSGQVHCTAGGWNRTTWWPPADAGISSPGTSSAGTGGFSGLTGSLRISLPVRALLNARFPAATCMILSGQGFAGQLRKTPGRAGAPSFCCFRLTRCSRLPGTGALNPWVRTGAG